MQRQVHPYGFPIAPLVDQTLEVGARYRVVQDHRAAGAVRVLLVAARRVQTAFSCVGQSGRVAARAVLRPVGLQDAVYTGRGKDVLP